jgi:hypothetical protein
VIFIFSSYFERRREGVETMEKKGYQEYEDELTNKSYLLEEKNAANISFLKEKLEEEEKWKGKFEDLSGNVTSLMEQVNEIGEELKKYSENMLPSEPPNISGI